MDHVRAVFFDAGGTLIHPDRRFLMERIARHGLVVDDAAFLAADRVATAHAVALMKTGAAHDDATRWRAWGGMLLRTLGCDARALDDVAGALRARHLEGLLWTRVEDGAAEVLGTLRDRGYTLVIVSNADGRVADFLAHAGLAAYFDAIVDSGIVGVEKPDPRIFEVACDRAGVAPGEAVHIGDILEIDVAGATAAGVRPILFDPYGTATDAACLRITALDELADLLAGAPAGAQRAAERAGVMNRAGRAKRRSGRAS
jgi:HAD superfamily hydrolase (TIGR01509 family)